MPPRLLLLDMDDVVYAYDRAARIAVLAAGTGLDPERIERAIWGSGFQDAADRGAFATVDAYLDGWRERLGVGVSRALWTEARRAGMTPVPGVFERLAPLAEGGAVAIGVLTNNGPLLHAERETLVPELARLAGERFLVSACLGAAKPDPDVYVRALDRLGFAPAETLFIDDRADNVAGARSAGLRAAQVRRSAVALDQALLEAGLPGAGAAS